MPNSSEKGAVNVHNHRRYKEVCGHVHGEIAKMYITLCEYMIDDVISDYPDGVFEKLLGALAEMKESFNSSLSLLSSGGLNVMQEGESIAKRQVEVAKAKIKARRGWTITDFKQNGYHHIDTDALSSLKSILEYEEEIENREDQRNGKFRLCFLHLSLSFLEFSFDISSCHDMSCIFCFLYKHHRDK